MKGRVIILLLLIYSSSFSSGVFPLYGDKVREMGYELPKPYGITVMGLGMKQGVDVESIDLMFDNKLIDSLVDKLDIEARDANIKLNNITLKADLWILPFLNLYTVAGYTQGDVSAKADVSGRILGKKYEIEALPIEFKQKGFTYGGGGILAGGYRDIFFLLDANYTYTSLDIVDGTATATVIAPRLGWDIKGYNRPIRVWIGGMYQDFKQTVSGDIYNIVEIDDRIKNIIGSGEFEVSQKGSEPWTYTLGASIELLEGVDLILEYGFGKNTSLIGGIGYRF